MEFLCVLTMEIIGYTKNKGLIENLTIFSLAINGNNIYSGTVGGIFLSTNNGDNWKNIGLKDTVIDVIIY